MGWVSNWLLYRNLKNMFKITHIGVFKCKIRPAEFFLDIDWCHTFVPDQPTVMISNIMMNACATVWTSGAMKNEFMDALGVWETGQCISTTLHYKFSYWIATFKTPHFFRMFRMKSWDTAAGLREKQFKYSQSKSYHNRY